MSADDVLRVTWHGPDGADLTTYTVHDEEDGALAIVTRNPVTFSLYCHRCHQSSRAPCAHIDDVITWVHAQQLHRGKSDAADPGS